ncbi:hypothetical protein PIB30_072209 [Stylosanthes scabra]|uniref:SCP domain-containing protein n=1 Tax=Stylosanthes scabra TaxID=79078 RepID=A0ABU6SPK3_9FABA|nr:hypothetical protein [Stylosanthes scabra]
MERVLKNLVVLISFLSVLFPLGSLSQNRPEDYLAAHNAARKNVGVLSLKWNPDLKEQAQHFLNKHKVDCMKEVPLAHVSIGGTIALKKGSKSFTGFDAAKTWVVQGKHYNHISNSCVGGECRGYTQVVWKTTTHVGCARVTCDNDAGTIVCCDYEPPGNISALRPY